MSAQYGGIEVARVCVRAGFPPPPLLKVTERASHPTEERTRLRPATDLILPDIAEPGMLRGLHSKRMSFPRLSSLMAWPVPPRYRRRRRAFVFTVLIFSALTLLVCYTRLSSQIQIPGEGSQLAPPHDDDKLKAGDPGTHVDLKEKARLEAEEKKLKLKVSEADAPMSYGTNARPPFKNLVLLGSVADEHVPRKGNGQRYIMIGDVHGMCDELKALLDKVKFDGGKNDHLVLAGDMVNKGPDSPCVIDLLMRAKAYAVRGNHEDRVLLAKMGMLVSHVADAVDGTGSNGENPDADDLEQEVFSHGDYADRNTARSLTRKQLEWLADLPVILQAGHVGHFENLVVVHAGLVPGLALRKQDPRAVMNMRSLVYPREDLRRAEAKAAIEAAARLRAEQGGRGGSRPGVAHAALVEREYQKRKKKNDREVAVPIDGRAGERWTIAWNEFQEHQSKGHHTSVVFGHDSKQGLTIEKWTHGMDSGCVRGGDLTALVITGTDKGIVHRLERVKCKAAKGYA